MLYLNDVPNGGETVFNFIPTTTTSDSRSDSDSKSDGTTTNHPLSIAPVKGDGLIFFPCGTSGAIYSDQYTLHEAMPAIDEKWVSQVWISAGIGDNTTTTTKASSNSSSSSSARNPKKDKSKPMSKAARRRMQKKR